MVTQRKPRPSKYLTVPTRPVQVDRDRSVAGLLEKMEGTGFGGPGYTIKDELPANNRNARGTISMANAGPNTGGSQFFINVVDNGGLDRKHPVFGRVVGGMDVVDAITRTPTDNQDRPRTKITIQKASVVP